MITHIEAAQRLDSRGKPTVQVCVTTDKGIFRALVPSGASKGQYEALELRDGDKSVYQGNGVLKAVHNVNEVLAPAIVARKFDVGKDLAAIDALMREMDGTADKSKLGANAILGISMACARAGAAEQGVPLYEFLRQLSNSHKPYILPVPFFNVLNGGVHSGNLMAFQEFMIAPVGASSFTHAVQMGSEIYQTLKEVIKTKFDSSAIGIGDEGGFAPPISKPHEALDLLIIAIEKCGYTGQVKIGIDPASGEFFSSDVYDLGFKNESSKASDVKLSAAKLGELYRELISKYPIVLLEDPFAEDDWEAWTTFNQTCSIELVGDDLLATNIERIKIADEKRACNGLLLKINQIGTITEAIEAQVTRGKSSPSNWLTKIRAGMAFGLGWGVFVSHRSGETTDDFIADLTVALGTGHLKSGSPCRGERVAKYNRLMDIEAQLNTEGQRYIYAGPNFGQTHVL